MFRLLQLDSQPEKAQGRDDTKSERHSPCSAQVVLGEDEDEDHWHESCNNESSVDGEICREYEISIAVTLLQLASSLSARHTACRIFASDTDTKQEAISGQGSEQTLSTPVSTVGACAEGSKDDEDDSRYQQRVLARPVITEVAKNQLTNDCSCEGDGGDVALRAGACVFGLVNCLEHSIDGTNDLRRPLRQCLDKVSGKA